MAASVAVLTMTTAAKKEAGMLKAGWHDILAFDTTVSWRKRKAEKSVSGATRTADVGI